MNIGSMTGGYGYPPAQAVKLTPVNENSPEVKNAKRSGSMECETCKTRKYQDGSNEGDVSFKAPGHISPSGSYSKVMAHEQEHVANAYQKAAKMDGQVLRASVSMTKATCPECGRSYVSDGQTTTQIKYQEENPYSKNAKSYDQSLLKGMQVDFAA